MDGWAQGECPRLGAVKSQWGQQNGKAVLILQNALGLSPSAIALPAALGPLAGLCDGTRDVHALRASLMVRAGVNVSLEMLLKILTQMDEALLFESSRQAEELAHALRAYRQAASRPSACVGSSYPAAGDDASAVLRGWLDAVGEAPALPWPAEQVRGVVSPHIDYARGGATYAGVWSPARAALEAADLVVILGTDHHGAGGSITLSSQHYATPWGALRTDNDAVAFVAGEIGQELAFVDEYHHAIEHSVELAAVWLHFTAPAARFGILPILCGSFEPFVSGGLSPDEHPVVGACIRALRALRTAGRRVVYVAAADLAHIGPAFGGAPAGPAQRRLCATSDEALLSAICHGDAEGFLDTIRTEGDRRNVCGVPPIYLLLRALGEARGQTTGYEQCPADAAGTSLVSIAGALLW